MLRLITLGRIDLTDAEGRSIEKVLKRPKPLAVLAYLAAGGAAGALRSRDTVLGLFWPEQSQASARAALSQSLYVLRQALGKDVVVSVGNDQIGLAPGALWCDAVAVRSAAASGDHRSAQLHYRGEFLPGLYLSDAPDFEKWLETERDGLQRLASSSAWKLATEAVDAGDVETAAWAAIRSAELALREESAVRRAMELLDGIGERARALDLYRDLEAELAEDFDAEPAPETQEVVARIRGREPSAEVADALRVEPTGPGVAGHARRDRSAGQSPTQGPARRGAAPHRAGPPPFAPEAAATTSAGGPAPRERPSLSRIAAGALAVLAVGLVGLWLFTRPPAPAVAETVGDPHLMVEPFEAYAADARLADVAGAITTALAGRLAEVDAIDVLLVRSGEGPSADSAARAVETPERDARAWFIVRGRVARDGDRVQVVVSLIDRSTGQVIASADIERVTTDLLGFVDEATEDAATFARAAIGRELRERAWRASTTDAAAWRLLERAEADRRHAATLFEADAFGAAATALAQADSTLERAEARQPRWNAPTVLRAQVAYDRMWHAFFPAPDLDEALLRLRDGIQHADRAISRDTTDARAREMRGILLHWLILLEPEVRDSTVARMRREEIDLRGAVTLDPERARAWSTLSGLLAHVGRFEEAYYAAGKAYEADAFLDQPEETLTKLFFGAFETGDDAAAARWCAEMRERFPANPSGPLCELTMLAWPDGGDASPDDARAIVAGSRLDPSHPFRRYLDLLVARVIARSGDAARARAILDRVSAAHPEDQELMPYQAAVHLALGEADSARILLRHYIDERPASRQGILSSRRFAELREAEGF